MYHDCLMGKKIIIAIVMCAIALLNGCNKEKAYVVETKSPVYWNGIEIYFPKEVSCIQLGNNGYLFGLNEESNGYLTYGRGGTVSFEGNGDVIIETLNNAGNIIEKYNNIKYMGYPAIEVYFTKNSRYYYNLFVSGIGLYVTYSGPKANFRIFKSIVDDAKLKNEEQMGIKGE